MFAIEVQKTFHASHALRLPNGGIEPLHAHDFQVTVKIAADSLDPLETVLDFHEVQDALSVLLDPWQNQNLNDIEPFKTQINPSAERIAEYLGQQLSHAISPLDPDHTRNIRLLEIRLTEAPNCLAIWSPPPISVR